VRKLATVMVAFLVLAPAAAASGGYVEVVDAAGHVLASATGPSFDYPADGTLVHVGHAVVGPAGVELNDVSVLGGAVSAQTIVLPRGTKAIRIVDLVGGGRQLAPRPDTLVPLGSSGYLVVAQQAVLQGSVGRVGLRVVLQANTFGATAGTQLLVGLPFSPQAGRSLADARAPSPLAVLGFASGAAVAAFVPAPGGLGAIGSGTGTLGERAVTIAGKVLGVAYRWGGAEPFTGFDCSGLEMYVYAQLGIPLTHYTGAQFGEGVPVAPGALEPGDLVFFDGSAAGPQHEGIYIGEGRFIHAPHTGDVVRIASLADPQYGLRYVGAVRPSVP